MLLRTALCCLLVATCALSKPVVEELDPVESADLFEGDIDLDEDDRSVLTSSSRKWPKAVVYYRISSKYSSSDVSKIKKAMSEYEAKTCIRFKARTSQSDYVYIQKIRGCTSKLGKSGGAQRLSLADGCVYHSTIIHELMHALGFTHEQSRHDRDKYVKIIWKNIREESKHNFEKYSSSKTSTQGLAYDYGSVMHYRKNSKSIDKSKLDTIVPLKSGVTLGNKVGFSKIDLKKINKWYGCSKYL